MTTIKVVNPFVKTNERKKKVKLSIKDKVMHAHKKKKNMEAVSEPAKKIFPLIKALLNRSK